MDDISSLPRGIQEAIIELSSFPSVLSVTKVHKHQESVTVGVLWQVSLPNSFKAAGISATGIREEEPIQWVFPIYYPREAPTPLLRIDFPINLPHINPYKKGDFVSPCISEVPLIDLLHSSGLSLILERAKSWLNDAAADELICPIQGWEHVRRDNFGGIIMANVGMLRSELEHSNKPFRYYKYTYLLVDSFVHGELDSKLLGMANTSYKTRDTFINKYTNFRHAPCIILQTPQDKVIDQYYPETVSSMQELKAYSKMLGVYEALKARFRHLASVFSAKSSKYAQVEEFLVIFAVKRPFKIIGENSKFELLPYRVMNAFDCSGDINDNSRVTPINIIEITTPNLLKNVSGKAGSNTKKVCLIGCGSLGSKLALHFAKSGVYEFQLIDNDYFSSHNNARHALVVRNRFISSKVELLDKEIKGLGVNVTPFKEDIRDLGSKDSSLKIYKRTDFIIDTTASLPVRYFLAHEAKKPHGRLIHTLMYGEASVGVVAIEGSGRSVRIDDLAAFLNGQCISSPCLQQAMYGSRTPAIQQFGEGCSSYTSQISDIDLSLMSATISSKIDRFISSPTSTDGVLSFCCLDSGTGNLNWTSYYLQPTVILQKGEWEIRISGDVAKEVKLQSEKYTGTETGGVLAVKVCALSKTVYITNLIDAPADSTYSSDRFNLSTTGLADTFDTIHQQTNYKITFFGTWHSHPENTPPSSIDIQTLKKLQADYDLPIIMLVFTGGEFVLVED